MIWPTGDWEFVDNKCPGWNAWCRGWLVFVWLVIFDGWNYCKNGYGYNKFPLFFWEDATKMVDFPMAMLLTSRAMFPVEFGLCFLVVPGCRRSNLPSPWTEHHLCERWKVQPTSSKPQPFANMNLMQTWIWSVGSLPTFFSKLPSTLPETDILAPKNRPPQKESSLPTTVFRELC